MPFLRFNLRRLALAAVVLLLAVLAWSFVEGWFYADAVRKAREQSKAAASASVKPQPAAAAKAPAAAMLELGTVKTSPAQPDKAPPQQPRRAKPEREAPRLISQPVPSSRIEDRYAAMPVEASRIDPPVASSEVSVRLRLIRDVGFKYPLILVRDELRQAGKPDEVLVKQQAMVADHLLVKLAPQADAAALIKRLNQALAAKAKAPGQAAAKPMVASVRKRMVASGLLLIAFSNPGLDGLTSVQAELSAMPDMVSIAEPDYLAHALLAPNDTYYSLLWGLNNDGSGGGIANFDINAPEAWDLHTGSRNVVVGCIDTGIDYNHEDIAANSWTNPDEIAGNGLDDDDNGYIDDVRGWDFVNADNDPNDDHYHGTHTAGTIGAESNDAQGVTGVCWQVSLMALKFLDDEGSGVTSDAVDAIYYATAEGAFLTSNSWGGDGYSQTLGDAIEDANEHGRLFIAAAGNEASDNEANPTYPASYELPNVITVAGTTRTGALASFSNYGSTSVHIGAPGLMIGSTAPESQGLYIYASGTSMAAPHVSGVCALLKSYRPALTSLEVKAIILGTARPMTALAGKCSTGGQVDAFAALSAADDLSIAPGGVFLAQASTPGGLVAPLTRSYTLSNNAYTSMTWTAQSSVPWLSVWPTNGTLAAGQAIQLTATLLPSVSSFAPGKHEASFTVTNSTTNRTQTLPVRVELPTQVVHSFTLDALPEGWTTTGEWAYGVPTGRGGKLPNNPNTYGEPDPTAGVTGTKVLGVNLAGDYSIAIGGPYFAKTAAIDMTGFQGAKLSFHRWLNSDFPPYATATVEVSNNGSDWTQVWINADAESTESDWTQHEYDIANVADNSSTLFIRWGYSIGFGAWAYSGWNLDDIEIAAAPIKRLTLSLASYVVTEGDAAQVVTASIPAAVAEDVEVSFTLGSPTQANLSAATATILAGQTSATVTLTAVDDAVLTGTRSIILSAAATGYVGSSSSFTLHDNESTTLALELPPFLMENAPPGTCTLTLGVAPDAPLTVQLSSSDLSELVVPQTVTVPAGQTTQTFTVSTPNDDEIDGNISVTVAALVQGWAGTSAVTEVRDNEALTLRVTLPTHVSEDAGSLATGGEVSLSAATASPLTLSLTSALPSVLGVPETVSIPAGSARAFFALTPVPDAAATGHRSVSITAALAGFTNGSASTSVSDSQTPATPASPSPAHLATGVNPESDLAWSIPANTGGTPSSYEVYLGTTETLGAGELLGSTTSRTYPLARLTRGTTYYWRVVAHLSELSVSSPTWSFTVPAIGPAHHFVWSSLTSPQRVDVPFNATLTAQDEFNDTAVSFAGTVTLSTRGGAGKMVISELNPGDLDEIEFTNVSDTAVDMSGWKVVFYDESSWPASLATLTLGNGTSSPAGGVWRVQEWGSPVGSYPLYQIGMNLNWTENTRAAILLRDRDGELVDFVIIGASPQVILDPILIPSTTGWSGAGISPSGSATVSYQRIGSRDQHSAADWTKASPTGGTANTGLTLPFPGAAGGTPLSPATTPTFTAGVWTGAVQVLREHPAAILVATDEGGHSGSSTMLAIDPPPAPSLTAEPAFTGSSSNTLTWGSPSSGTGIEYEIERAASANFASAVSSDWLATQEHTFTAVPDGLQHFRVRARRVPATPTSEGWTTGWSASVTSTHDTSPPVITINPTDGGYTNLANKTMTGQSSDLSGITALSITPASGPALVPTSSDGFVTWSQLLADLPVGQSSFTITASDAMSPPNTGITTWRINRLAYDTPLTESQVIDLFALATNTNSANPSSAQPAAGHSTDPLSGKTYLTLSFRRRILPSGFIYLIETSTDLQTWSSSGGDIEELSTTPTGDGLTETCTCRLTPAIEDTEHKFMRLRVEVQ